MYKILAQSEKFRKIDAITSVLQKTENPMKFKALLRFRTDLKPNDPDFIYNYTERNVGQLLRS